MCYSYIIRKTGNTYSEKSVLWKKLTLYLVISIHPEPSATNHCLSSCPWWWLFRSKHIALLASSQSAISEEIFYLQQPMGNTCCDISELGQKEQYASKSTQKTQQTGYCVLRRRFTPKTPLLCIYLAVIHHTIMRGQCIRAAWSWNWGVMLFVFFLWRRHFL